MLRILAQAIRKSEGSPATGPPPGDPVFRIHPLQLSRYLEDQWAYSATHQWEFPSGPPLPGPPLPLPIGAALAQPDFIRAGLPAGFQVVGINNEPLPWEHMIYAYLIESTGVMEILGEVVRRFAIGETLESPDAEALAWLRSTEELFYREPPLFSIVSLTSQLRPEARINRRNSYWRLFGMDLPQPYGPAGGPEPWKQLTGAVNNRFREIWVELLRQVWLGITNARNSAGANPTDPGYVAYLCQSLADMAEVRRRGGMLAREEHVYPATLSWFHLAVQTDTPIVRSLRAETGGGNAADRLRRIGERVGMTPSPASRELFELADQVAVMLRLIESKVFNAPEDARLLFDTTVPGNPIVVAMTDIIDRWQSATGDPIKQLAVTLSGGPASGGQAAGRVTMAQPVRLPEPVPTAAQQAAQTSAANGSRG